MLGFRLGLRSGLRLRLGSKLDLLRKLCFAFDLDLKFYFSGRVGGEGGWVVGESEVKAKLNSSCC